MTRVDELQKKYPGLPRDVVIRWDVNRSGMGESRDLDSISEWERARRSYQSYDHDVTLKELAERRPERIRPGFMLRPPAGFRLRSGIGAAINFDSTSPYQIREVGSGSGQFALFEGEEKVEDVFFPRAKQRLGESPLTVKGTPATDLVDSSRGCFRIVPVRYCEYFALGEQCKFCNFNPSQEDARAIGISRATTISLPEVVEAYRILGAETRSNECRLEMGGFMNSDNEGRIYFDFVEQIANSLSYRPNIGLITEAMSRQDMLRLKEVGLNSISIQMEVWDPRLFSEVCPGKAKHTPYEGWLEAILTATEVFGAGNVACTFVGGVTMVPPDGHRSWQEARDSHIEGNEWLIKHGVFPAFTYVRVPPGSVYGADPDNRAKLPPTDYYLEVAGAHHKDMLAYGLYDKLNKLNICGLCCSAGPTYYGEVGVLAQAGDLGAWMSDAVPAESNWVAKFVSSLRPPSKSGIEKVNRQ